MDISPYFANFKISYKAISSSSKNIANRVSLPIKFSLALIPLLSLILFFSATIPVQAQTSVLSPREVAEYALTLEKLEADFYRRANNAAQNGGLASAPQIAKDAIASYGEDESRHVTDISAALSSIGGNPNTINIPDNPNYNAILGRDPFANPTDFLQAGQYIEDLGVAAYKGQVQNLLAAGDAGKPILAAALAIHSVEARHAAGIRALRQSLLGADVRPWISTDASNNEVIYNENRLGSPIPFNLDAFDGYATKDEVLALVNPLLLTTGEPVEAPTSTSTDTDTTPTTPAPAPVRGLW